MWSRACKDTFIFLGWNPKTIISALLLYCFGLFIYWIWKGTEAMIAELGVMIAFGLAPIALAAVLLFAWNLARAPVFIKFEKEKKPRLKVVHTQVMECGEIGKTTLALCLEVINEGTDEAHNCQGRLVDIDFVIPQKNLTLDRVPRHIPMQWMGQLPNASGGIVTIPGKEKALLQIAYTESSSNGNVNLDLAYANGIKPAFFLGQNLLTVVSLTSQNTLPIYCVCLLKRDIFFYNIEIVDMNLAEQPIIEDYRQKLGFHTEVTAN